MQAHRIALILAIGFFIAWLGILYAGADHPPPRGFLWVIPFDAAGAWVVNRRTPVYLEWSAARRRLRRCRALGEGWAMGLLYAGLALLIPGSGEPSIEPPGWGDRAIWFAVVGAVGAVTAVAVYGFAVLLARIGRSGNRG